MSNEAFKAGFSALMKKTGAQADAVVRKVAMDLQQSLVFKSPVDTGRFRGNWQCGIGAADTNTGSSADGSGGGVMGRTNQTLNGWRAGQTIYLTNSMPYARRLEYGWSKQAPQGMVRLTVAEYGQFLNKAVKGPR